LTNPDPRRQKPSDFDHPADPVNVDNSETAPLMESFEFLLAKIIKKMLVRNLMLLCSGKMSALNEVNKVIAGVAYTPNRYNSQVLDDEVSQYLKLFLLPVYNKTQ
jgi:hypothetical protein